MMKLLILQVFLLAGFNQAQNVFQITSNGFPMIPQYRFRYYMREANLANNKFQEDVKHTGQYAASYPHSNVRTVRYMANDVPSSQTEISIQPPTKKLQATTSSPFEVIAPYGEYRTGISPNKYQQSKKQEYKSPVFQTPHTIGPFVNSETTLKNANTESFLDNTSAKSIEVELNYKDDPENDTTTLSPNDSQDPLTSILNAIRNGEQKAVTESEPNGKSQEIYATPTPLSEIQTSEPATFSNTFGTEIPSSLLEIINRSRQNLRDYLKESKITASATTLTPLSSTVQTPSGLNNVQKSIAPSQRPMRLVGMNPIFVDSNQLVDSSNPIRNIHLEPLGNVQYIQPTPMFGNQLLGAIPTKTFPRSVPNVTSPLDFLKASFPLAEKADTKSDKGIPMCNDCVLAPSYVSYPYIKPPQAAQHKNCQHPEHDSSNAYWNTLLAPYKSGVAFLLLPPPQITNKN